MERQTDRVSLAAVVLVTCGLIMSLWPRHAEAAGCADGVGLPCTHSSVCASRNTRATVCVAGSCAIPCVDSFGNTDPNKCAMGEACVRADIYQTTTKTSVCKAVPMVMDLNLLDTCIFQFVEGAESIKPPEQNSCSTGDLLLGMLDRDANGLFDIYDVDSCITDFLRLYEAPCTSATNCADGQIYCENDAQCGQGSHCDKDLRFCRRECGFVVDRGQPGTTSPMVLDRPCWGRLKTCDYSLGKCVGVDLNTCSEGAPDCHACQVDAQCPNGAYCFVGKCTAKCTNALDCPDANWYCSETNTCRPRPREAGPSAKPFNPKNYSILLSERQVTFSVNQKSIDIPVLIMDLTERKPVFDSPNVVFGYRLETKYSRKQDPICLGDLTGKPWEVIDDCNISDKEEFVTMENPFGVIYGDGDPRFRISLNDLVFEKLTPGLYEASLTAIFNNGDMDTIRVIVTKPTPSGEYLGQLSLYLDNKLNFLGRGNVGLKLFVDNADTTPKVKWDDLLRENNLYTKKIYEDVTEGYPVSGYLHGSIGMLFDNPTAEKPSDNELKIKGIYSPHLGRMRLIAVIDVPKDYCKSEDGRCMATGATQLQVRNRFGRDVQRIVEFIGPFDPLTGVFHGYYRETVSGLLKDDITLSGDFSLSLMTQDATRISLGRLRDVNQAVTFPSDDEIRSIINRAIDDPVGECKNLDAATKAYFVSEDSYGSYLAAYPYSRIFPRLKEMKTLIGDALASLNNSSKAYLTFSEFANGRAGFCGSKANGDVCVDKQAVLCGLNLYRKAFIANDWVDMADIELDGHALFCSDGSEIADCSSKNTALATLHEHNRFYQQLVQTYAYEAGSDLSDAFYTMYKAAAGSSLENLQAHDYKVKKLQDAMVKYDAARSAIYSPDATLTMVEWPMGKFAGKGEDWLGYLETASTDRMATLVELIDLKRRLQKNIGTNVEAFASHVLHDEYLVQVLLLALRQHWHGYEIEYPGTGPRMMEQGDLLLTKVSQTRNPLGLHHNRVYFENNDLQTSNWENYRARLKRQLDEQDFGLIDLTNKAIDNLQRSLSDEDALYRTLKTAADEAERQIDDLCGAEVVASEQSCTALTQEQREYEKACDPTTESCESQWICDPTSKFSGESTVSTEKDCSTVAKFFNSAVATADAACRVDSNIPTFIYKKDAVTKKDVVRTCTRGRMGALIQERKSLQLQRDAVIRKFNLAQRQIAREQKYIEDIYTKNTELLTEMSKQRNTISKVMDDMKTAELVQAAADGVLRIAEASAQNPFLGIPAGAWATANAFVRNSMAESRKELELAQADASKFRETHANDKEMLLLLKNFDSLLDQLELIVIDYDTVVQQIANVTLQMDDTLYLARRAAERLAKEYAFTVDRLIGRESGSVLLRNRLVAQSNQKFQEALVEAYKMTQAFIYQFDRKDEYSNLVNNVYKVQSINDLKKLIADYTDYSEDFCSINGNDPDCMNNTRFKRVSMREALFPNLRDIQDAKTGKVLTAGQQFHNIITTSPQFVKSYNVPNLGVRKNIVLPLSIFLDIRGTTQNPEFMVDATNCLHTLVQSPSGGGTLAVSALVSNGNSNVLNVDVWRGGMDYMRSCKETDEYGKYKINVFTMGYGQGSSLGKMDNPPSFITRSDTIQACDFDFGEHGPTSNSERCMKTFARDRSLAASDWKVVVPLIDIKGSGANGWIMGDGMVNKPVIEDIILYFRTRSIPISAAKY